MAVRTNEPAVRALLSAGGNYRKGADLTPFIESASATVDDLVQYAADNDMGTVLDKRLELIERWLAAHDYQQSDKGYTSRSNEGASGSFEGQTGKYLESTRFGQRAINLDPTGYLALLVSGGPIEVEVGGVWLGKATQEQLRFDERNL